MMLNEKKIVFLHIEFKGNKNLRFVYILHTYFNP